MSDKNLKQSLGLNTSSQITRSTSQQLTLKTDEIYAEFTSEIDSQVNSLASEIEAQIDPNQLVKLAMKRAVANTRNGIDLNFLFKGNQEASAI